MERINETEHAIYREKGIELDVLLDSSQHTVWLTQKQIAALFKTSQQNVSARIKKIYEERQLNEVSTHNSKAKTFTNNGRTVTRIVNLYNLDVVKAIRGRNESDAADRFLAWADMLVKGIRNKIANFCVNNLSIDVLVSPDENTVWLT